MKKDKQINKPIEYDKWFFRNKILIDYIKKYDCESGKPIILQVLDSMNIETEIPYILITISSLASEKACFISKKIDCKNRTTEELNEGIKFDIINEADFGILVMNEISKLGRKIFDVKGKKIKTGLCTDENGFAIANYKSFVYFMIKFKADNLARSFFNDYMKKRRSLEGPEKIVENFINPFEKEYLSFLRDISYQVATVFNVSHKNDTVFEKALSYQKKYFSDGPDIWIVMMTSESIKKLPKDIVQEFEVIDLGPGKPKTDQAKTNELTGNRGESKGYKDKPEYMNILNDTLKEKHKNLLKENKKTYQIHHYSLNTCISSVQEAMVKKVLTRKKYNKTTRWDELIYQPSAINKHIRAHKIWGKMMVIKNKLRKT